MELRHWQHWHPPSAARSWLAVCLALLVLVPAVSTQGSFQFLQPLPTPVQCQTYDFAWTGGTPTYTLSVSVSQPWDASYGIGPLDGQGFSWVMPFPAGHTVSFELRDNAGHVVRAGPLTIQPSKDTSCIDPSEVTPSSEASSPTTTPSSKTIVTSSTTAPGSGPTGTPTTASTTATAPTPGKPPSTGSASSSSTSSDSHFTPSVVSLSPTSQPQYTRDGNGSMSVITTIVITPTTSASDASPSPHRATLSTGSIAGVAVGGAAILVLVGFVVWFCRRRCGERRRRRQRPSLSSSFGALAETKASTIDSDTMSRLRFGGSESDAASPTSTQRLTRRPGPLPLPLSTPSSPSSPGSDPFSAVSPTSTQRLRPGPGPGPLSLPDPSSPSSPGSESDPFASSLSDGSRRFILPASAESEDYVPVPASYGGQWRDDRDAARSRTRSACESPVLPGLPSPLGPVSAGIPNLNRPLAGPRDDSTLASLSPDGAAGAIDAKRDFPPRDLPVPVPPPSHPPPSPPPPPPRSPDSEAITPHHAAPPTRTDGRLGSAASTRISITASPPSPRPAHPSLVRFEEDGGVRLAGGLPGEVLDDDGLGGDDAGPGGWLSLVQPPPYQRFR